jgi:hypothetical protein
MIRSTIMMLGAENSADHELKFMIGGRWRVIGA